MLLCEQAQAQGTAWQSALAEWLKPQGYVCGQFGESHLGDRDEFLPTVHGFDVNTIVMYSTDNGSESLSWRNGGTTMFHENSFQTNGVLIDEAWCRFFHDHGFLVGLSLDGLRELHDACRRDKGDHSVFDQVVRAVRLLQKHQVEFNILCTVNAVNSREPVAELVSGAKQRAFGRARSESLPRACRAPAAQASSCSPATGSAPRAGCPRPRTGSRP